MTDLSKDFESIQNKVDSLQKLADSQIQPPKKFKEYTKVSDPKYRWNEYRERGWSSDNLNVQYYFWSSNAWSEGEITQESLIKTLKYFDSTLNEWVQDNLENRLYNEEVIKHNQLQYERVERIMETLGVKKVFSSWGYKTSRSRKMTENRKLAEWPNEVRGALPINCGYEATLKKLKNKRDTIEAFGKKWIEDNEERIRKEKEEAIVKEESQRKLKVLAGLCVKYNLDLESEEYDILQAVIGKCRYLYLAHYLECNRNDWNDGCDYAETGLSGFDIVTKLDQEIYDDVNSYCKDWDGDGRCFRDCKFNYSTLYSMVDEGLMKDYNAVREFWEQY